MKKLFIPFSTFLVILQFCFTSCLSMNFSSLLSRFSSSEEVGILKNWDSVNRCLEPYRGNSFEAVIEDFGHDYAEGEDFAVFYSPTEESSIRFSIKKGKVKGYSYDGSYADMQAFLSKLPAFKNSDIQVAANAWLGFSPDLLKETFGPLVHSSTDKLITVGPSETACIEFTVGSYSPTTESSSSSSSEEKRYIKKVKVNGSYDELENFLVSVPDGSLPVRKIKQKNM